MRRGSHSNIVVLQRLHKQNPAKQEKMRLFPGRLEMDHGEERANCTQEIKEHRQELAGRQHRDVYPECTLHSAYSAGLSKTTKAGQLQSNVRATILVSYLRVHGRLSVGTSSTQPEYMLGTATTDLHVLNCSGVILK